MAQAYQLLTFREINLSKCTIPTRFSSPSHLLKHNGINPLIKQKLTEIIKQIKVKNNFDGIIYVYCTFTSIIMLIVKIRNKCLKIYKNRIENRMHRM